MADSATLQVDVAILGGGIAGLWLLARLRQAGYSTLLLESQALGAGQTIASQGIIHGGLKYAIDLKLGGASDALADMPARWRACLNGTGEIDLRAAKVATERHLFWARKSLVSRITGFFGSKLLRGRVDQLDATQWPEALRDPEHVGAVYALDEIVLDVPALVAVLAAAHRPFIKKIEPGIRLDARPDSATVEARDDRGRAYRIAAARLIATAGKGNEDVLSQIGAPAKAAQRRPLHMVMLDNAAAPLWAHCFDAGDKPRVTITTHRRSDNRLVWYIGGLIAENGVKQSPAELIATAKTELSLLLPRLDFSHSRFATHPVDRAEGATPDGSKPDGPVLQRHGAVWIAWPTKLALSPQLADQVLADLPPASRPPVEAAEWATPDIAKAPWETAAWS